MKKVMFYHPSFYLGGTEIGILNLVEQLSGVDIYIGYTDKTSDVKVLEKYKPYAKVIDICQEEVEVDVLVICSPYIGSYNECNNVKRNKTYLWLHYTGDYTNRILESDEYINKIDKIVAVSKYSNKMILERYNQELIKDKIEVIFNAINEKEVIEKSNAKPVVDIELAKDLNLISISRLCKEKGFDRKVELARILKEKGVDFKWYIIGSSESEELKQRIVSQFEDFKENVIFLGYMQNPYPILKKCDYLALLSDEETWGLVVSEAKILKVPCVVTDFEVIHEQITDKENGIIIKRENFDEYEKNVNDILENKERLKSGMKEVGYNNEEIIKNWKRIIEEI